jgi:hypothetical protein
VLASDGANLAAAFQTIVEIGDELLLMRILDQAFPGCVFYSDNSGGRFRMMMQREGLSRPLEPAEFSDGTLRFLCLAVALLSPPHLRLSPSTNRKTACIRRCCAGELNCRGQPLLADLAHQPLAGAGEFD